MLAEVVAARVVVVVVAVVAAVVAVSIPGLVVLVVLEVMPGGACAVVDVSDSPDDEEHAAPRTATTVTKASERRTPRSVLPSTWCAAPGPDRG